MQRRRQLTQGKGDTWEGKFGGRGKFQFIGGEVWKQKKAAMSFLVLNMKMKGTMNTLMAMIVTKNGKATGC